MDHTFLRRLKILLPYNHFRDLDKLYYHRFLFINDDGKQKIRLIDWEYAGMQDPDVDLAMFAIYSLYTLNKKDLFVIPFFSAEILVILFELTLKIFASNSITSTEFLNGAKTCDPFNEVEVKECMAFLRAFHEKELEEALNCSKVSISQ